MPSEQTGLWDLSSNRKTKNNRKKRIKTENRIIGIATNTAQLSIYFDDKIRDRAMDKKKTFQIGEVRNKKNEIVRIHDIHTHFTSLHFIIVHFLHFFFMKTISGERWVYACLCVFVLSYSRNECNRIKQNRQKTRRRSTVWNGSLWIWYIEEERE